MKKELFVHFAFLVSFFIFITVFKNWFNLSYWPFWVGGVVGTLLPDIDHLIYVYFLRPLDLTSQRVSYLITKREILNTLNLLAETRYERKDLVFHTILFQIIFLILTFWIIVSSGSLLGQGIVLAFSLHLLIDQIVDLREVGNLDNWFKNFPIQVDANKTRVYWGVMLVLLLFFGFLM